MNGPNEGAAARKIAGKALLYLILVVFCVITIYPLVWMLYSSVKTNGEIMMNSFALPSALHPENYAKAWTTAKIGTYFANSLVVTVLAIGLTLVCGASAAFMLAKFKFRSRDFVLSLFIVGMLIPMQAILVPLFIQMKDLRLIDTLASLVLAYTAFGLPLTIFVLESFIRSLPDSILEAAVLDGASLPRLFMCIILPMSGPAVATVAILNFLTNWKEFSLALIFISTEAKKTLPLGLYNFIGAYSTDYAQLMAAMTIASLPLIVMYALFQDRIIDGMADGAVKN
jgi:raffinose/stachyose/melibiose transport system permease protein